MKTWQIEFAIVMIVLVTVNFVTGFANWIEWLGSAAVLMSFGHAQVSDRMAEKEAIKDKPDVHCYAWSLKYYLLKEGFWLTYFVLHHSYAALAGVAVFLIYPIWRKLWRKYHPLKV